MSVFRCWLVPQSAPPSVWPTHSVAPRVSHHLKYAQILNPVLMQGWNNSKTLNTHMPFQFAGYVVGQDRILTWSCAQGENIRIVKPYIPSFVLSVYQYRYWVLNIIRSSLFSVDLIFSLCIHISFGIPYHHLASK